MRVLYRCSRCRRSHVCLFIRSTTRISLAHKPTVCHLRITGCAALSVANSTQALEVTCTNSAYMAKLQPASNSSADRKQQRPPIDKQTALRRGLERSLQQLGMEETASEAHKQGDMGLRKLTTGILSSISPHAYRCACSG